MPVNPQRPAEPELAGSAVPAEAEPGSAAQTSATAEENTIEAQGASPERDASVTSAYAPATAAGHEIQQPTTTEIPPEQSSVISPLRGAGPDQAVSPQPVMVPTPSAPNGAQVAEPAPSMATRPDTAAADDIVYTPFALSVGDGFKFGCGLVLAIFVTIMTLALIAAIAFLVASLAGVSLPLGMIGK